MNTINKAINEMIQNNKGQFFNVTFTKKDGTTRTMLAQYNKTEQINNPSNTAHIPKYLTVKEYPQGQYRTINTDTIKAISIQKQRITID